MIGLGVFQTEARNKRDEEQKGTEKQRGRRSKGDGGFCFKAKGTGVFASGTLFYALMAIK